ncbi:MAG: sulfatase [Planctomycetes bacterium]|nr:sulfatase [Planctomycetota bacterium]
MRTGIVRRRRFPGGFLLGRGGLLAALLLASVAAARPQATPAPAGDPAADPAADPTARHEVIHLLERIGEAKLSSILLQAEPLGRTRLALDQLPPEKVHDEGRTRLWRIDVPLTRGPDGLAVAPTMTLAGAPLPPEVTAEVLPSRVEVHFKDHPDFKTFERAGDVHGNRYIVFSAEEEIAFKVPLPDFPVRLGLSAKVLGTQDDFTALGKAPHYAVSVDGKPLGEFDGTWKLNEQLFDLPVASGSVEVRVKVTNVTPQKGGMAMLRSFALVAADGCDRLLVRAPSAVSGLVADYAIAAPPAVQTLFDQSLEPGDLKEWSGDVVLLPGPVSIVSDFPQEYEVLVDAQPLGRVKGRGAELRFEASRLGRAKVTLRTKGALRGTFHLVQPRAIFSKLRDPMESLRDPSPFVRGLESTGTHPLVRHVMSKDDTRLALLAPAPTTMELPFEFAAGDRFEVSLAAMPLVEEKLLHPPVFGRARFVREDGKTLELATLECNRKRRVDWERTVTTIPAEAAGRGVLRFESACDGGTPLAAFEALFAFGDPVVVRATQRRQPNVLVYLIDTLRADHCTPYGYARDTTPNLARLAAEGITFERAYSQAPWTRPSVATLFSSYLHSFHGASKSTGLAPQIDTLAERLRRAGYATAGFLANAHVHGASLNFEQGFSHFEAIEKARQRGDSRANQVHDSALAWLEQQRDRPFFLYLHTIDPHAPYDPPEATRGVWSGAYDGPMTPRRTNARELTDRAPLPAADLQHVLDLYDEEILYNDREFGKLCDWLRERGLWDDTIVLVVSDHGEEFWEHEGFGHGTQLWNELLHVPLIVKPDRRAGDPPGGHRVSERVRVMDVPQTLLARAGIDAPPAEFMGVDLGMAFRREEVPELPVIAEEHPDRKCLIVGDLKWINWGPKCRRQRTWLFNLADDPFERNDLSETHADVARRMQAELERIFRDYEERGFQHWDNAVRERLGAGDLEALQQLGYLEATGDEEE